MLKNVNYLTKRRELLKYFKEKGYDFKFMSNKELERFKKKFEIQENLETLLSNYKQVLDILVYISRGNNDIEILQKTKEIIYSLPGLEKEVSKNICENTFEDADKCKEYLKNLLEIIENKFYEIIK